ncbi:uncharacterized protein LOC124192403 [Daphnia pulex]|uniref:uncharacterized protein LOC124192403 n=1 Tax=Daphnia pulex TaxID=6669 RepID=UPI001EE07702|nr:uncharacterized protein LOC124192403 [Daphnia pulex]XP_046650190.1 uncharacterized protein LOC124341225 [Daphnia pulicaria]
MNFEYCKIFIRMFHRSAVNDKISSQARIMMKIMGSDKNKKEHRFFVENQSTSHLPDFLGRKSGGNAKITERRVAVLNSVFLEKISDILVSSRLDHGATNVHQHGFFVTKVKVQNDGSALHVYWYADKNCAAVIEELPKMGGWLRHELSQLHNGRVPHINFIFDRRFYKSTDVEDLLKIADFGPDYNPDRTSRPSTIPGSEETPKELNKISDVLGIDRNAIMNQVLRSMNHIPKSTPVEQDSSRNLVDSQRQVDFKKYLHEQEVLKMKMERRQNRAMMREAEMASRPISKEESDLVDEEEDEDYIDQEIDDIK